MYKKVTIYFGNVNLSHHLTSFSWSIVNLPFILNKKQRVKQSIEHKVFSGRHDVGTTFSKM